MPVKPLPKSLVQRLRKLAANERLSSDVFGRMKNLDHRGISNRVREMNVSRNYPRVQLAIKHSHGYSAQDTINIIKRLVRDHNASAKPKKYVLVAPKAYAIGQYLLAMAKTDKPSVYEIIGDAKGAGRTQRGMKFFEQMRVKHKTSEASLKQAFSELHDWNSTFTSHNVLLLSCLNGKFIFMPLLDVY